MFRMVLLPVLRLHLLLFAWLLLAAQFPIDSRAGGVTLITHGLNGNVDDWISAMAERVPDYPGFPGTNFSCYELAVRYNNGFYLTTTRVAGAAPAAADSGEILVKLDWSELADGTSYDTYEVAAAAAYGLMATNLHAELNGHALAELPLHLIGHSRGGSLVCELSRLLGTNGVWVDHLTTLDPRPLNNDGFSDPFPVVDAPARTYNNVLYHDNYWQNLNFFVYGEPVAGAYVRKLTSLSGGYGGLTASHSDVHLWYHGTIDLQTISSDGAASITSSERQTWWNAYENAGERAGFGYSLIGSKDRLSPDQPLGTGFPRISDGFNQWWDLGVGTASNRTALSANTGEWPNLIRVNRTTSNAVVQGQSTPLRVYYQWAKPIASTAWAQIYLDVDRNPLNTNQTLLQQIPVPGTTAASLHLLTTNVVLQATNVAPGTYSLLVKMTAGARTRSLYAPEPVEIIGAVSPPTLDIAQFSPSQIHIAVKGQPGQTLLLQHSTNLMNWMALTTNSLAGDRWVYTNNILNGEGLRFYRAVVLP